MGTPHTCVPLLPDGPRPMVAEASLRSDLSPYAKAMYLALALDSFDGIDCQPHRCCLRLWSGTHRDTDHFYAARDELRAKGLITFTESKGGRGNRTVYTFTKPAGAPGGFEAEEPAGETCRANLPGKPAGETRRANLPGAPGSNPSRTHTPTHTSSSSSSSAIAILTGSGHHLTEEEASGFIEWVQAERVAAGNPIRKIDPWVKGCDTDDLRGLISDYLLTVYDHRGAPISGHLVVDHPFIDDGSGLSCAECQRPPQRHLEPLPDWPPPTDAAGPFSANFTEEEVRR